MIEVKNIDFSYQKDKKIIKDLSFHVPKNSIFGFLGENGSGKTTTIRILLNLCKADSGSVVINNSSANAHFYKQYKHIGTLIESPTFYQQLTAWENLKLLADYYNVGSERIKEVLVMVGLFDDKDTKVNKYSLGMKQRLGIAQSILHNPEILILDEPINGLDPRGIKEIRELLFKLKEEGKTIFISSHLLDEIEKTCDYVCIIDKGEKLFSGKVSQLHKHVAKQELYNIKCSDAKRAAHILRSSMQQKAELFDEHQIGIYLANNQDISKIVKLLVNNDIDIFELVKNDNSLEDIFLKLTEK